MVKEANTILSGFGTTIFTVMSALATRHGAINLGQGFPDQDGPEDIRDVAARVLMDGPNQYPPMMGMLELRQAVADHNHRFYGIAVNPETDILVTSGATEALADCLLGLINPGDEVVLFEPLYDCYLPLVLRAGGVPKFVRLDPPNWEIREDRLREAFSERTKLVLLNTPMNPTGKVFTVEELQRIAHYVQESNAYAVCDEVYEHLVFGEARHVPLATLPGMGNRTVRIGSAGKTFSLTGWKVGYITGCTDLIGQIAKAHQFVTFTTSPALQLGVAYGLNKGDEFYTDLRQSLEGKRDRLKTGLEAIGFKTADCDGTYFINADIRSIGFEGTDEEFCRLITTEAGVAAVPVSAFYVGEGEEKHFVRFCFCKQDAVLDQAVQRLSEFFSKKGETPLDRSEDGV
ncbi:aminotransferase [Sneathiella chinensis]|uniref:Aminotransferase n=1 Tax=Sneathiella chinensis TaxID=349750 RepID=A0ABQ5U7L0_9PROT|nr:aminotransferase [Sneathiella chinensis]GLQ07150.1 aminotransferase [Sneathiella chinensis]